MFETFPNIAYWYLPAGLSLALLLAYGLPYAFAVAAAQITVDLWVEPLTANLSHVLLISLSVTAVYLTAAAILRRTLGKAETLLESRQIFGQLLLGGMLTSIAVSLTVAANLALAGLIDWNDFPAAALDGSIGAAIGILSVTPFLILHGVPFIDRLLQRASGPKMEQKHSSFLPITKPDMVQVLLLLPIISTALWVIFTFPGIGDFLRFCLLSLPLVWIGLAFGLEGVTAGVLVVTCGSVVVLWSCGFELKEMTELQVTLLVSSLNGMLLGSAVTKGRLVDQARRYRDAVLNSVSFAADRLLGVEDWEKGFNEVLKRLGEASNVSRLYFFESRLVEGSSSFDTCPYEWAAPHLSTNSHQLKLLNLLRVKYLSEHVQSLSQGKTYHHRTQDLPEEARSIFSVADIGSTFIVPIFVERQLWGCLGFDRIANEPDWMDPELDTLKAAAQSLGTLLARVKIEAQFRKLSGNIRAVFWMSSPDGLRRTYVSAAYEQIWGRSRLDVYKRPESWLDAIYHEDAARVKSSLTKQMRGEFDEEYRIVLPDRSMRWIRDRGSPVRNELGEISQIVGLAEDITGQKQVEEKIQSTTLLLVTLMDNLKSGILVEDSSRRVRHVNEAFCEMFEVPVSKDALLGTDSRLLFPRSESFAERIEAIVSRSVASTGEEINFNGKCLTRNYVPLSVNHQDNYHLWQYQNITERKLAEEQIKGSLEEKEVLLKEIHHRVKNNLQVISSLLSLQCTQIQNDEVKQLFADSQSRVRVMALVHEQLYQSHDLASIDFSVYVRNLTNYLIRSYQGRSDAVRVKLEVAPVPMSIDTAITCGLIISELVSNCMKYAFPKEQKGEVSICLDQQSDGSLRLSVHDNGVGFPTDIDFQNTDSLGLKLVRSLTEQLGGSIHYRNDNGSEVQLQFALASDSQRREAKSHKAPITASREERKIRASHESLRGSLLQPKSNGQIFPNEASDNTKSISGQADGVQSVVACSQSDSRGH
jgi:PAS domain S-box-containing protein